MTKPKTKVDEKLEELSEYWGSVYIVKRPVEHVTGGTVTVRNHTDEGLGLGDQERKSVRSESLNSALNKALKQTWTEEDE